MSSQCWVVFLFAVASALHPDTSQSGIFIESRTAPSDWLLDVPNTTFLKDLNIPGTHDTFTWKLGVSYKCHDISFEQQLLDGIRYFDMRCRNYLGTCAIHHTSYFTGYYWINMPASNGISVGDKIFKFLTDHPSEFILLRIKEEYDSWSTMSFADMVKNMINQKVNGLGGPNFWYTGPIYPPSLTVGDVRGKIVLLQNFDGAYLSTTQYPYAFSVQDDYSVNGLYFSKWSSVVNQFYAGFKSRAQCYTGWFVNHASGWGPTPIDVSNYVTPRLSDWLARHEWRQYLGIVVMDFYRISSVNLIINSNFAWKPKYFRIQRSDVGKVLEIDNGGDDVNSRIQQYEITNNVIPWQHWFQEGRTFRNRATGMVMQATSTSNGAAVVQVWKSSRIASLSEWTTIGITISVVNICLYYYPNKCIEINNGSYDNKAGLQIWDRNNNVWSRWIFSSQSC